MQVPLNFEQRLKMYRLRVGSVGGSEDFEEWTADKDDHGKSEPSALEFLQKHTIKDAGSSLDGESVTLEDMKQESKDDVDLRDTVFTPQTRDVTT